MADEKTTTPERGLLFTTTGEIFQPVRLHYELFDEKKLAEDFR